MADVILLFLILYFVISGLQKGFFNYLLEFLLVFVCVFGSWLYYKETYNLLFSLIILFASPIVLASIFKFLFHVSTAKTQHIKSPVVSHLNNIAGGAIGFLWGIIWSIVITGVINLIPIDKPVFVKAKDNFANSYVMRFVKANMPFKELFLMDKINRLGEIMGSPKVLASLRTHPRFQKLMEDEKIQAFMRDKIALRQLQEKKILSLLDNPKFKAILEDPVVLKKFVQLDLEGMAEYEFSPVSEDLEIPAE